MENIDSYLFLLKKFISGLLMPVPMTLLLLVWAVLFLLRGKTRWLGAVFTLLATALLFVGSYTPLSSKIAAPLEQRYATYQPAGQPAEYVAVLGNSHVATEQLPITSELSPTGIVRITEGIRVYRLNPGSKLIFTGYTAGQPESYAEKAKQLALALGVPEADILAFNGPKDTAEEAALIAANFAGNRLVLVTSAMHMPRAMELFQQVGLNPIPAPTDHLAKPVRTKWMFPDAKSLFRTRYWIHEQLGLLWSKLTSHVKKQQSAEQH
ncbi:ElyC/SanA/YdcF family protein [Malonomonas rubra]|uniref:ElyC/SanA/YdcF family protein n=1 Tax=Malonomonas rubra TaxID=57040 RepID=UPI0026ED580C|nr:ElyC/SanA/YdcF family protein [Malonomonas rubra]